MLTLRTFTVSILGAHKDTVHFVGEEYDEPFVKRFLIDNEGASRDIIVKLIREVKR